VTVIGDGPLAVHLASRLHTRLVPQAVVRRIDRRRRVVVAGCDEIPYSVLVLATGTRPLVPAVAGLAGCAAVTSVDEVGEVGETTAVIGGGVLAVEVAAALAARGAAVTLVFAEPFPLLELVGERCAGLLAEALVRNGVALVSGRVVRRSAGELHLADGSVVAAQTVLSCAGTEPDTWLARAAGLRVDHGVVVDMGLRTSDPRILAVGPCSESGGRVVDGEASWAQADALADGIPGAPGAGRVLRLRAACVDLAGFTTPGLRQVELRGERTHARLALDGDHLVAAVLFGHPEAAAALGLVHRRGGEVPRDLVALLLELPPATDDVVDAVICLCNNVSEAALGKAWAGGARTVAALATATRATTGCGGCTDAVAGLCAKLRLS
jgi:assimilatory nitrate reductase electron transfer subunit